MDKNKIINSLFNFSENIRYVAIYKKGDLLFKQKNDTTDSSSIETDKYEELLVNPTLLTLTRQRGNIDCGGLNFLIISYGKFYQLVKEIPQGHISICLNQKSDLNKIPNQIFEYINKEFPEIF